MFTLWKTTVKIILNLGQKRGSHQNYKNNKKENDIIEMVSEWFFPANEG